MSLQTKRKKHNRVLKDLRRWSFKILKDSLRRGREEVGFTEEEAVLRRVGKVGEPSDQLLCASLSWNSCSANASS